MINDQSGQAKLDYYVDDHIKLSGLTSLTGRDRTIEFSAVSNEDEIEEKTESVKLTSVSHEDVKQVLELARKVGLAPRLDFPGLLGLLSFDLLHHFAHLLLHLFAPLII